MPLHDWTTLSGWSGVRHIWIVELLHWIKPRLPAGYRVFIGSTPTFAIDAPGEERPAMMVFDTASGESSEEPEQEIAVPALTAEMALFVECQDRLIAAVELVSPRNKDRASACGAYTNIYAGYLLKGVNLLLVDVHPRPDQFSFADAIAQELQIEQLPACPVPFAISYRVGEKAPNGGRVVALWRRPLTVGLSLPTLPLALSVKQAVPVDLEETYGRAAAAAYLS